MNKTKETKKNCCAKAASKGKDKEVKKSEKDKPKVEKRTDKSKGKKTGARKQKEKKAEDVNKPKRPQTSYQLYLAEARAQLAKDEPNVKGKEVLKKVGEMWNALSEDAKKPYIDKAAVLKEEYEKKCKELGIEVKKGKSKGEKVEKNDKKGKRKDDKKKDEDDDDEDEDEDE